MKLIVVGNIVFSSLLGEGMLQRLKERYDAAKEPDTELFYSFSSKGVGAVEQEFQIELGATYLLKQVMEVDEEVYDGLIIPCGLDPCLVAAREYLTIPIICPLSAASNLAGVLGRKFSIIYPEAPGIKQAAMDRIRIYDMEAKLASIRTIDTELSHFRSLSSSQIAEEVAVVARKTIDDDGADVILLGCGAMEESRMLSKELGVPVIDLAIAALKTCELVVNLGLSHSKVAYPHPRETIPANVFL